MNGQLDLDAELRRWMADGPNALRDDVIAAALEQSRRTRQQGPPGGPWRFLTMSTTTLAREGRPVAAILAVAALLILAVAIGAYFALRPDIGIGDDAQSSSRIFEGADVIAVVEAPAEVDGLVAGAIPSADLRMLYESDSAPQALRITLVTSVLNAGLSMDDEARRQELSSQMYAGLEDARVRFYDASGPGGQALPANEPGGASFTVLAASYADAAAASAAFDAYVAAYESWEFTGTEAWSHADQSAAFAYSTMDRVHARCHSLRSLEPCDTGIRVWRVNNMIITLMQQGEGAVTPEAVVAAVDAELR